MENNNITNYKDMFLIALSTINKIDDFLEYRYKSYSTPNLRAEILKYIDNFTKELRKYNN